jgi:hypothetical protein
MASDEEYLSLLLNAIRVCRLYKPRFGSGKEMSVRDFEAVSAMTSFTAGSGLMLLKSIVPTGSQVGLLLCIDRLV